MSYMLPTIIFSYYTSLPWPVSPVLFENVDLPIPLSEPPKNLLTTVHYSTLSTVHSMVLISVSAYLTRDKHPYWSSEIVSPYRNGLV